MKIRRLEELADTENDVVAENWRSRRFVLARDGVGFSFHDTVLHAGTVTRMWYKNHIESVYCIEGEGELLDVATGQRHEIRPGTLYLLDEHDRHELTAHSDLRMMCVFNPPLTGEETHQADGSYPLLTEEAS